MGSQRFYSTTKERLIAIFKSAKQDYSKDYFQSMILSGNASEISESIAGCLRFMKDNLKIDKEVIDIDEPYNLNIKSWNFTINSNNAELVILKDLTTLIRINVFNYNSNYITFKASINNAEEMYNDEFMYYCLAKYISYILYTQYVLYCHGKRECYF